MQVDLNYSTKKKVLDIFNASIARHPTYRDNARAYHAYGMGKERPQIGVRLNTLSTTRMKLSPNDALGEFYSRACILPFPGTANASLDWVWEAPNMACKPRVREDVTSRLSADRMSILFPDKVLAMGPGTPEPAAGYGPVRVWVNDAKVFNQASAHQVDLVGMAVPPGATVEANYFELNAALPGLYFLDIISEAEFNLDVVHEINHEVVIEKTTGTETDATLSRTGVMANRFLDMYTQRTPYSTRFQLRMGQDFMVDEATGQISFLAPLNADTTLFCSYRFRGAHTGPHTIEGKHRANITAIPGVILAFGDKVIPGDKQVVQVTRRRERVAKVTGSHFEADLDLSVFARDPQTAAELCDHLVSDIWGNMRLPLTSEGFIIDDLNSTGDSQDTYNESTGDMMFLQGISMRVLVEWKKFVPYVSNLSGVNIDILMAKEFLYRDSGYPLADALGGSLIVPTPFVLIGNPVYGTSVVM